MEKLCPIEFPYFLLAADPYLIWPAPSKNFQNQIGRYGAGRHILRKSSSNKNQNYTIKQFWKIILMKYKIDIDLLYSST